MERRIVYYFSIYEIDALLEHLRKQEVEITPIPDEKNPVEYKLLKRTPNFNDDTGEKTFWYEEERLVKNTDAPDPDNNSYDNRERAFKLSLYARRSCHFERFIWDFFSRKTSIRGDRD